MNQIPQLSRNSVNRAGRVLAQAHKGELIPDEDWLEAFDIMSQWRTRHSYPINTFQATLRDKLRALRIENALVAQRLKRAPSILNKLVRFEGMMLARMQDIGGLRAVVPNMTALRKLHESYTQAPGRFRHKILPAKDYIETPKDDGYRSLHQVFKYKNPRASQYNGLCVELQIRTRIQHAWATAVETMGTFLNQGLKIGGGEPQYRNYLKLCSALFAHLEKCPPAPGYTEPVDELAMRLRIMEQELRIIPKLQGFSVAARNIDVSGHGNAAYNLVILNITERKVRVRPFTLEQLTEANDAYAEAEKRAKSGEHLEVVLVSAGPIKKLKKAYPNYFLDTASFVSTVQKIIRQS